MGNRRIITDNSSKHFTKEEKEKREQAEQQMKDIGLSFDKEPELLTGLKHGKKLYNSCKGALIKYGLLNDNTYNTFGILCYNYHMYIEACESTKNVSKRLNVKSEKALSKEEFEKLVYIRDVASENEKTYFKHFRQLCGDFGFTPSSLLKLMDAVPKDKEPKIKSIAKGLFG